MPVYSKIQFINHVLYTLPDETKIFWHTKQNYAGIGSIDSDIAARVEFVYQVIQKAKNDANVRQSDKSVLKVFMMPEFSFRGPTGAYTMEEAFALVKQLQECVKGTDWQHWLFVFGTVVCKSYSDKVTTDSNQDDKKLADTDTDKVEVYNIAFIQKGGFQKINLAHQYGHSVMKRYKSELDFIKGAKLRAKGFVHSEKARRLEVTPVPKDLS